MKFLFAFCLAAAPLLPPVATAVEPPAKLAAAVERVIEPLLRAHEIPGLAVGVTLEGQSHFFSFGVTAKEGGQAVTERTLFELGSISKTFTATLACQAVAAGKLALADAPGKYLPELRGTALEAATLLHLGTYTPGGMPLQVPAEVRTLEQMVGWFRAWKPVAEPGTVRTYSNPSIGLFGYLAARSMGRDFTELMEKEIFAPLGLRQTFVRIPSSAQADYAWGHNAAGQPVRVNPGVFENEAYGVKSCTADLIRFLEAELQPERLAEPLRRAIEGTQVGYFRAGEDMVQGLGWEQYPYPISLERLLAGNSSAMLLESAPARAIESPALPKTPTLFNKTGSTGGFGGYVVFIPARRIGLVLLANKNYPIPARVRTAFALLEAMEQ